MNKITNKRCYKTLILTLLSFFFINQTTLALTNNNSLQSQQRIKKGEIPKGLNTNQWKGIQKQIALSKYVIQKSEDEYFSRNAANNWLIKYKDNGQTQIFAKQDRADDYLIGLKLVSLGYTEAVDFVVPKNTTIQKERLTYIWNDNIQEIWTNTPTSLEQWFEIKQKPKNASTNEPLVVTMELDTKLYVEQRHNALYFANKISYDKLKVWDSQKNIIPATMQLKGKKLLLLVDDSKAIYPLTIDPRFQQQAYLKAFNSDVDDSFGVSVSISGDTLVVGAPNEDSDFGGNPFSNTVTNSGAVYIFERNSEGVFTQNISIPIKASNSDSFDKFGASVSISGDLMVIGAPDEDSNATGVNGSESDNSEINSGAAYVFKRNTNGSWIQEAYLKASNTEGGLGGGTLGDRFGSSVAISGTTIVIGAPDEDSNSTGIDGNESNNSFSNAGAVYVFKKNANTWSQDAYLKASNTGGGDHFGQSVAVSNQFILVGAPNEDSNATGVDGDDTNNGRSGSGAAYVFTTFNIIGGSWVQDGYLKGSNTDINDLFGSAVSIDSNIAVVAAPGEDSNAKGVDGDGTDDSEVQSGAAYVFKRSAFSNNWFSSAYLKASNTQTSDQFGAAVSVSGSRIVIGAIGEDSLSTGIDDSQNFDPPSDSNSGAVYVFLQNSSNIWSQVSYVKSSNSGDFDNVGKSVAISGNDIVIGAPFEDDVNNDVSNSGAIYVISAIDNIWGQQRVTKSDNIDVGNRFGHAIAMSEKRLIVGSFKETVDGLSEAGAVYVFRRNQFNQWANPQRITASNPGANDWFGYSVAISGESDTVVVGARNEASNSTGINGDQNNNSSFQAGAVYVFVPYSPFSGVFQQAYIKASNTGSSDFFGFDVAISGDTLVVGAVFEDSDSLGIDGDEGNDNASHSGAAYVFVRDASDDWSQQAYLKSFNSDINDEFGRAVAIAGDTIVVSANREDSDSTGVGASDNNDSNNSGAIYVFDRDNGIWSQESYIKSLNAGAGDEFGRSIAISKSGKAIVVGARKEDGSNPGSPSDNSATDSGAVYVFKKQSNGWVSFGYIKAPINPNNLDSGDWFGDSVAIGNFHVGSGNATDNYILVGASREDSNSKNINSGETDDSLTNSGAAYTYVSNVVGDWTLKTYFKASNSGESDSFGSALALSNNTIVIGASLEDSDSVFNNDNAVDSGAIYIFNSSDLIFKDGFD